MHFLPYRVKHLKCWCTFSFVPDFLAKTQNPSILSPRVKEFAIPSLLDFVDGDQVEMLLCLVRVLRNYLSRTEEFCLTCANLFIMVAKGKK